MAVLQAWPGRGFWQGLSHGQPGTLAGMTSAMAQTPQPGFLSAWVNAFTAFDEAHGFAVNLFAVVALVAIGAGFLPGARGWYVPAVITFAVLCLADWVLIEDFGFFGGLGTDPNSMLPFALLAAGGYLALDAGPGHGGGTGQRETSRPGLAGADPAGFRGPVSGHHEFRSVAVAGALGLIILGAAPMAAAQASPNADPILAEAIAGSSTSLNFPARRSGSPTSMAGR